MQSNQLFTMQISGALLALLSACGGAGSQPCTSKISGLSATLADCALHPLSTPTAKPSTSTTPAPSPSIPSPSKAELIVSSVLLIPNTTPYLFLTHPEPVTASILQFLAVA